MITEEQLAKRAEELGRQISDDYKGEEVLCIGILKGSVMFMADLIKNITVDTAIDFMAVSSYGGSTKSSGVVRILKDLQNIHPALLSAGSHFYLSHTNVRRVSTVPLLLAGQ